MCRRRFAGFALDVLNVHAIFCQERDRAAPGSILTNGTEVERLASQPRELNRNIDCISTNDRICRRRLKVIDAIIANGSNAQWCLQRA